MARGAAQARKRPQEPPKRKKNAAPSWEEQLFFSRLRRHAKVMYVVLAIVFAGGFVFLGVGSGSTGIGDLLQGHLFGNGSTSTSSQIHDKQQAVERSPQNVQLYLDLASLYQADQENAKALQTLRKAQQIAPKNADVLNRIAGIYAAQAATAADDYRSLYATYASNVTLPPGVDTSSTIGQAFTSDPYSSALQSKLNDAYTKATSAFQKVANTYKQAAIAAKGTADEPNALLQWATAAQNANDLPSAISAYQRFLKVAPDNPNAATVRQTLAQIQASAGQSQR